jgi:PAS domain-containing protein
MREEAPPSENLDDLRQRKDMFGSTWMLAIVLSASSIVVFWYLGLCQVDIAPIIWILAGLALVQFILNSQSSRCGSAKQLRALASLSQLLGILVMGVAWHLYGGLQQPMFTLFIMLPLFTGALILNFWQQQAALLLLIGVLVSGVLLSPDTNSFIEERYGLGVLSTHLLPAWIPRSRVAFLDVSTSPTYNLMLTGSLAVLASALTATSRAMVALSWRSVVTVATLRDEVEQARRLNSSMVEKAPNCEVLISPANGRILIASERFTEYFGIAGVAAGQFLLDTVAFAYPVVIKRLITAGGEEVQGATVQGREVVLRVRAALIDTGVSSVGASVVVRLSLEPCDEICWRGAVDALSEPVFAINPRGRVIFLNRSAVKAFGIQTEGSAATDLFDKGPGMNRWWDIAPLESTRRMLMRGGRRYLASIRRERVAESVGELSFIHLTERQPANVPALS